MDVLLIFLVALAIVTIVGHLLWRLIALIFGFRVQTVRRNRPHASVGQNRAGLEAQLDRLVALRLIDPATRERVLAAGTHRNFPPTSAGDGVLDAACPR